MLRSEWDADKRSRSGDMADFKQASWHAGAHTMRAAKNRAISRAWRDGDYLGTGAGNVIVGNGRHSSTKRCMHVRKRLVVSPLDILDGTSDPACLLPHCTTASSSNVETIERQMPSQSAVSSAGHDDSGVGNTRSPALRAGMSEKRWRAVRSQPSIPLAYDPPSRANFSAQA